MIPSTLLFVALALAQTQTAPKDAPAPTAVPKIPSKAQPAESSFEKLLRIIGLTATPSQMKGSGEEVEPGNVWVVDVDRGTPRALTTEGGYRSPVFSRTDGAVYAVKGDSVVRLSAPAGSRPVRVPGIIKLVGFDGTMPDDLVVLRNAIAGASPLAVVSTKSGTVTDLPYDASTDAQRRLLAYIRGQERAYGNISLYLNNESKAGRFRNVEWTDVYMRRGTSDPKNLSVCDGVKCAQPSLSSDGKSVAFVKIE